MVIGQGIRLAVVGVIVGMSAAAMVTRLLEGMLYGVSGVDPLAIGFAGSTLIVAALFASWTPARRAARVDPIVALRQE
jgi:ABC-type antimicrobial peptide transport system permease subunit